MLFCSPLRLPGKDRQTPRFQPGGSVTPLESVGNFLRKLLSDPGFPVSAVLPIPRSERPHGFFQTALSVSASPSARVPLPSCLSRACFTPSLAWASESPLAALDSPAFQHRFRGGSGLGSMFTLLFSTCCHVSVSVLLSPGLVRRKSSCSRGRMKLPLPLSLVLWRCGRRMSCSLPALWKLEFSLRLK